MFHEHISHYNLVAQQEETIVIMRHRTFNQAELFDLDEEARSFPWI
jgi:hypothetical protein